MILKFIQNWLCSLFSKITWKTNYIGVLTCDDFRIYYKTTKISTVGYRQSDQKYWSMFLIAKPDEDISMRKKNQKRLFFNHSPEKFISDIGDWIEIREN